MFKCSYTTALNIYITVYTVAAVMIDCSANRQSLQRRRKLRRPISALCSRSCLYVIDID